MIAEYKVLEYPLNYLILCFSLYAFLGWCMETVFATIKNKRFTNRGFLHGPFCPMYGFGAVVIILFSGHIGSSYLVLYIICFLGASLIEYVTGFILEKLFNAKWWDYSDDPLNLQGRICITYSLLWGIFGVVIIKILHPFVITPIIKSIPNAAAHIFSYLLTLYFIFDLAVTLIKLLELKNLLSETEGILTEVKNTLVNLKVITMERVALAESRSKEKLNKAENISKDFWAMKEVIDNIPKELKERYENIIESIASHYSRIFIAFPKLKSIRLNKIFADIRDKIKSKVR